MDELGIQVGPATSQPDDRHAIEVAAVQDGGDPLHAQRLRLQTAVTAGVVPIPPFKAARWLWNLSS